MLSFRELRLVVDYLEGSISMATWDDSAWIGGTASSIEYVILWTTPIQQWILLRWRTNDIIAHRFAFLRSRERLVCSTASYAIIKHALWHVRYCVKLTWLHSTHLSRLCDELPMRSRLITADLCFLVITDATRRHFWQKQDCTVISYCSKTVIAWTSDVASEVVVLNASFKIAPFWWNDLAYF